MYSVGVVSLGCSKNRVDTELMLGILRKAGYRITADEREADILIVNTCGFIEPAKQESIDTLLSLARYKQEGKLKLLAATGCLTQRYEQAILQDMPEVDLVLGVSQYPMLPRAIEEALAGKRPSYCAPEPTVLCGERVLTTAPYTAYVRIADGCDNRCAYCAIPLIRGGFRSRDMQSVLDEIRALAEQGVKEHVLVAQDTSRFGMDTHGRSLLPELMVRAADIPGVEWLRALYCYPERVDERLLDTMKRLPNVCDYLDLPMQHISQHILTDMNRTDTSAHIREVCRMFKERGMMLRTTLMVGFPGETDEDFDELMDFVKQTKFDRMGAFMFCPEDGTRAAEMPNQIPEEVKQERYDRLMTLQHGISLAQNKARVGTTCRVLVEKKRGSRYVGRSEYEAPETDGSIFFGSDEPCEIGSFVNVKITGAKAYDLMGERI